MYRTYLSAVLSFVLLGVAAQADPINAKNAEPFTLTCDGQAVTLVTMGNGGPGHIIGSTSNLIPVAFSGVVIDDATGDVLESWSDTVGNGKRTGQQGSLIECTATFSEGGMTGTFTAAALKTPRGK